MTRGNIQFVVGLTIGITVSLMMTSYRQISQSTTFLRVVDKAGSALMQNHRDLPRELSELELHELLDRLPGMKGHAAKAVKFEDEHAHHDDDTVAKDLATKVRVLVWVMTGPQNLDAKAVHVRNTWGTRANKLLFMSSTWNSSFPTVGLNVSEGRDHLTAKTMQAFKYVYDNHLNDADWFMKADDDTYVIMENLRYLLSDYNSSDPIYFGHIFKVIVPGGYASGGAGYVLSKEALKRVALHGVKNITICRPDGGAEDAEMGKCLLNLGIKLMPSTDKLGRSRFHCFGPEAHLQGSYPDWYFKYDALGAKKGIDNISDYPVTFHYIEPPKMYAMEYFVYHLRPYGIISKTQELNR